MTPLKRGRWVKPLDGAVALAVAVLSAWSFVAFRSGPGQRVSVYLENEKFGWFDLGADRKEWDIPTRLGPVRIAVGDGQAQILKSPCPGQRCVRAGAVHRAHGEVACAPARLLLIVEGEEKGAPDAVSY